ncbi:MAG: hypothetical protein LQ340_007813 [Diploschistes diacapsis]|nr:MAG: hypothetical protein LQ340_007813 [Diploschistes diacapsis]
MSKKLLTIFGATGNQGGSIISVLLSHKTLSNKYSIRAITRDTSKPAAQDLKSKGCEVVAADLSSPSSLDAAVAGSYGVFAVTNYWEALSKDVEYSQGKAVVDACSKAGVQHLVWSSLPHTTQLTNGQLSQIDHFVAKAEVEEYIEANKHKAKTQHDGGSMWGSYYMPAFFMSNFENMMINPGPDGIPTYSAPYSPDTKQALIDIRADTGKYVLGLFEAGHAADGKRVNGVSEWSTPQAIVDTFTKYGGTEVKFAQFPRDVYKGFLEPKMGAYVAEEMTQNLELIGEWSYYGKGEEKKQAESDKFLLQGTKLTSFREFVEAGKPWKWGGQ